MKVRTKGYRGNILKGATLTSNDPKFPKKFLRITAQVEPVIQCQPAPYIFINKPFGKELARTLVLWSPVYPAFKIKGVKSLMRHVKVKIVKEWTENKATHYNLRITLGKDMPIGRFRGRVEVTTNLKKFPTYPLRISGRVVGPITVLPSRGTMFSDPKIMDGMTVTGFSLYGKNFTVLRVTTKAKGLKESLITVVPAEKYYLVAIWPGGPIPINPYTVHLKVHTNNAVEPVIDIPVSIYGRRVPVRSPKKRTGLTPPSTEKPPRGKAGSHGRM